MEKIAINPSRLDWCCKKYNTGFEELSAQLKISLESLEQAKITGKQLEKIANYFTHSLLFFLEKKEPKEEQILSLQFRTVNNQKPELDLKIQSLIKRAEQQRKIYLGLLEGLETPPKNWYPTHLKLDNQNLKATAKIVRNWLALKENFNFTEIRNAVEKKGIMLVLPNAYNGKWQIKKQHPVRGISLYFEKLPVIIVKKQLSDAPQAFTLLHELAHLLIHKNSFIDEEADFDSHRRKEKEANQLAANILVPEEFLNIISKTELLQCEVENYDNFLENHCNRWCVSAEVILRRFLDLKILPQTKYQSYREYRENLTFPESTGGSREWRHREPMHIFGKPFVATVLDAFYNKHITLVKASDYLDNLKIKDLHQLETYVSAR